MLSKVAATARFCAAIRCTCSPSGEPPTGYTHMGVRTRFSVASSEYWLFTRDVHQKDPVGETVVRHSTQ